MNLKRQLFLFVAFCFAVAANAQEVVQGVKLPRLTTEERDLIQKEGDPDNPFARGQVIFNLDNACLEFWNSTEWVSLCDKGATPPEVKLIDPDTLTLGAGTFAGKTCFDVVQTTCEGVTAANRTSQKTDFTNRTIQTPDSVAPYSGVQTYTFTATTANVSNVRYQIIKTAGDLTASQLIDVANTPLYKVLQAGALGSGSSVSFDVYYQSNLNSALSGKDRDNASKLTIAVIYFDGAKDVFVPLYATIQDCACCGAFTAPSVFKAFMCHNLGADYNLDPFIPAAGIHGAKYKWGTGLVALSQEDDQNLANDGGFGSTWASMGGTPPGTADDWNMSTANPCPAGFRIPTWAEWEGITNNNTWTEVGDWMTISATNYSSGKKVGTALFLPAAGYRFDNDGMLDNRGHNGYYWGSMANDDDAEYLYCYSSGQNTGNKANKSYGYSVRCIEQ